MTIDESLGVQIMHIGSYDTEPETVAVLDAFLWENGYENDMSDGRLLFIRPEKECSGKDKNVSNKMSLTIGFIITILPHADRWCPCG